MGGGGGRLKMVDPGLAHIALRVMYESMLGRGGVQPLH